MVAPCKYAKKNKNNTEWYTLNELCVNSISIKQILHICKALAQSLHFIDNLPFKM